MSAFRALFGAAAGAAAAGIALRVHAVARDREQPLVDVLADLPTILAADATRVAEAARGALADGREAATRAEAEFDEQVAGRSRRTKVEDG